MKIWHIILECGEPSWIYNMADLPESFVPYPGNKYPYGDPTKYVVCGYCGHPFRSWEKIGNNVSPVITRQYLERLLERKDYIILHNDFKEQPTTSQASEFNLSGAL